jgi:predicted DNA-binding transcriptional regulator AlpA
MLTKSADDGFITSTTARELAGGISRMAEWRWIKAGIIPQPHRIRGRKYWRRSEFLAALDAARPEVAE